MSKRIMNPKPDWWPQNPYPETIFPMAESRYAEIVPDPETRTALSGMLGRIFWEIASDTIWEYLQKRMDDVIEQKLEERKGEGGEKMPKSQIMDCVNTWEFLNEPEEDIYNESDGEEIR